MYRWLTSFFLHFLSFFFILSAEGFECVYPVAALSDGSFYLLYQNFSGRLELWQWDSQTQMAELALLTRFTPAGLQLMPYELGFSFIDNGVIRVKMRHKRSPKTLSLDKPLYDIKSVVWQSTTEAIVSASLRNSKGIFSVSLDGHVETLLFRKDTDYMYPALVDNSLFYIERDHALDQFIVKKSDKRGEEELIFQDFRPLVFLQMISSEYGLVLSHPSYIRKSEDALPFKVYEIAFDGIEWKVAELFSFTVPTALMFFEEESRLYESMLPLLPRYIHGKIYFYDSCFGGDTDVSFLRLCVFDKNSGVIPLMQSDTHYFGLGFDGSKVFVGGMVSKTTRGVCKNRDRVICVGDGGPPMKVQLPSLPV